MTRLILPLRRLSFVVFATILGLMPIGIFLFSPTGAKIILAAPNDKCFATFDGTLVFSSPDAEAVRVAVLAATPHQTIKIAGVCAGVSGNEVIAITKPLALTGGYTTTNWLTSNPILYPTILDALANGRVISAHAGITLTNIMIQNGRLAEWGENGAGLYAQQTAMLAGVTFYNNRITYSATLTQYPGDGMFNLGGGAYFGSVATLSDTRFISNSTHVVIQNEGNEYKYGTGGGAYFVNTAYLTMTQFNNNEAIYGGGAFFAEAASLRSADFVSNTAIWTGGAIFEQAGYLTHTNFVENLADYGGGATFRKEAIISDVNFLRNQANVNTGGAVFLAEAGKTILTEVLFAENRAWDGIAGGAYFYGYTMPHLLNVTFISNTANIVGGAYFDNGVVMSQSKFIGNRANQNIGGGAFGSAFGAETTVVSTSFDRNIAVTEVGGAVFGGPTNMVGASFISNVVTGTSNAVAGGAMFLGWGSGVSVSGTTFLSNESSGIAGGAFFNGATNVTNTAFVNNSALGSGGGVYIDGNYLNDTHKIFVNSLFAGNSSGGAGVAVSVQNRTDNENLVSLIHATIVSPTVTNLSAIAVASSTLNITNTIVASYTTGLENLSGTIHENYNLFSMVAEPYSGTISVGAHSFSGTVAFFNTKAYTLSSASMAIDTGANIGIPFDYFGVARPQWGGFDIGYHEARNIVRYLLHLPIVAR